MSVETQQLSELFHALDQTQAIIEFNLNGIIINANDNFLKTLGYLSLDQIIGQHHRIFCDSNYTSSHEYTDFWKQLKNGFFQAGQFKRLKKDCSIVWIQATYTPIKDQNGDVQKIVKFASDITLEKFKNDAISIAMDKSQAVIKFSPDGIILKANENFTKALGYETSNEFIGQHHSLFCSKKYALSVEYKQFWLKLKNGAFQAGQFPRIKKNGSVIWIQASYNPVYDIDGNVEHIIKYATDITADKEGFEKVLNLMSQTASQLAIASKDLISLSDKLYKSTLKTFEQTQSAADATEKVDSGIQSVATNMEEMTASIKEITRTTTEASSKSSETFRKANETNKTISKLGTSSLEIGNVVKVISSIAQQTNLLALNATIEAARAGESGRGFAVVANEVKELAKQTALATNDITKKIEMIQADSKNAVSAISEMTLDIDKLNGHSGNIAASVEEQAATTNEISRIILESSSEVSGIASLVKDLNLIVNNNSEDATSLKKAAFNLDEMAEKLNLLLSTLN